MRQISNSSGVRHASLGSACVARCLFAAISLFLATGHARAEPELTLSWSSNASLRSCPDPAWVNARVAEEIGHAPIAEVTEGVHAIVAIEKSAAGFLLSLRTRVGATEGERVIEGDDCRALSEAAILIVALSVSEASEARAQQAAVAPAAAVTSPAAPSYSGQRAGASELGFLLRAELVVEYGLLTQPTLGPGLALALRMGRYRAELAGTWLVYGEMEAEGEKIGLTLGAARVSGCALFGRGRVQGGPCLGIELGQVNGRNVQSGVESHSFWGAAAATVRLLIALAQRLSLVMDADLMASWGVLRFQRLVDPGVVSSLHKSYPVQLRGHVGLEFSF